jgi:hypothetical protein
VEVLLRNGADPTTKSFLKVGKQIDYHHHHHHHNYFFENLYYILFAAVLLAVIQDGLTSAQMMQSIHENNELLLRMVSYI